MEIKLASLWQEFKLSRIQIARISRISARISRKSSTPESNFKSAERPGARTSSVRADLNSRGSFLSRSVAQSSGPVTSFVSVPDIHQVGAEHEELAKAFRIIDKNGDGRISPGELSKVLYSLGINSSDEEFRQLMSMVDTNGDGEIDLEEFIHHNNMLVRSAELKAAFHLFDIDKNNFISPDELYQILRGLGEQTTRTECSKMIRAVDSDGDGQVNFQEFERMMTGT